MEHFSIRWISRNQEKEELTPNNVWTYLKPKDLETEEIENGNPVQEKTEKGKISKEGTRKLQELFENEN